MPAASLTPARQLALWLEYLQVARGLSAHTVSNYGRDLRQFLGQTPTLPTTPGQIESWLRSKKADSPRSNARRLSALRQFYAYAMEKNWVSTDPTATVPLPKVPQTLPKALNESQVTQLLAAPLGHSPREERLRLILHLLYATGLRVSELCQLQLPDVLQAEGPWLRVTGKGGKTRPVPLGPVAAETLARYLREARPRLQGAAGPWLLPGPSGKRPLTRVRVFQLIKEAGQRVGVAVAPHHLRHTFATHLLAHQADLRAVQLMLGHASLNTTQIYTKLDDRQRRAALEQAHPLNRPGGSAAGFGKRRP